MKQNPLPRSNHLVACLPEEIKASFFAQLETVELKLGQVIYEPGDEMSYVYFPTTAIVSMLYVMESGSSAEIAVVGNDGIVGIAVFMGGISALNRGVVQSEGSAYRMSATKLRAEFNKHGALMILLLRYTQALITQMSLTAVCNRHH